jgi:hypothetical protein
LFILGSSTIFNDGNRQRLKSNVKLKRQSGGLMGGTVT